LVPPHALRSSVTMHGRSVLSLGSSARAEIDHFRQLLKRYNQWFLRTRGDRPSDGRWSNPHRRVPPHARRSTQITRLLIVDSRGSSARAEIDRDFMACDSQCQGFLRTRGDRPPSTVQESRVVAVPPHARRSTRRKQRRGERSQGSSARAEIDPSRVRILD